MPRYTASYVTDNSYIIGNHEYGYDLSRIDFYSNLSELLTDEDLHQLADSIAELISDKIELSSKEAEEC